jgi:hypothetical protein
LDGRVGRKRFFFEKKKQRPFDLKGLSVALPFEQGAMGRLKGELG